MASSACMNVVCGASVTSVECRRGWTMRSGESAALCEKCGSAFEQSKFCDVFHSKESGWRECLSCGKRLHCGCIVSRSLLTLLDSGGINCIKCAMNSGLQPMGSDEKPNGFGMLKVHNERPSTSADNKLNGVSFDKIKHTQLNNNTVGIELRHLLQSQKGDTTGSFGKMKQDIFPSAGEAGSACFLNLNKASKGSFQVAKQEVGKANTGTKDMYESLAQTSLSITLGTPISNAFTGVTVDERENSRTSSPFQQGPRSRHLLPKLPKSPLPTDANANTASQIRVARPPAEGRGRTQLLPRYWPRITDQELQQISGDSNSTIVPLFEKVLSASDAGRIGRLVLPKACAEAYFPPISQPEGLPLKIQDIKGKEWVFQFRFWPNNNSRMYVLEGVTPCIQSMQLQAGDTVTFSRMEPEGKLVMGFRKASNSFAKKDTQPSVIHNGSHSSETFFSGVFENLPTISGYSGLPQSLKGSTDPNLHALSKQMSSTAGDIGWHKAEKHEGRSLSSVLVPDRKRARNIGSKSKRLLIDSEDALEVKLTWEEAQDLLRPPPSVKPSIVKIEDLEFEEYEEAPIFGKSSIFVVGSMGGQEQWAQCDSCMKWRRLPVDVLLPQKWTCAENSWDQSRSACSVPDELNPSELDNLLRLNKEFKKRRISESHKTTQEHQSSGLDALANAAILGDNVGDPSTTTSVATTTKHPRHRPGCSCIVCIQPPSGKGKHKPTCTCNVCMTVKRRFKTLMIRKKKRQLEREEEIAQRNQQANDEADVENTSAQVSPQLDNSPDKDSRSANELESKSQSNNVSNNGSEPGQEQIDLNTIDLNSQPDREEESQQEQTHVSMTDLPPESCLKENGLTSLANSTSQVLQQSTGKSEEEPQEVEEPEIGTEEYCETEKTR